MKFMIAFLISAACLTCPATAEEFDHKYTQWDRLLKHTVVWTENGTASQVDYGGMKKEVETFEAFLATLSSVSMTTYMNWTRNQQLAFLINTYNAFTVALILKKYPALESIRDMGTLMQNPWKKKFFYLLGEKRHLDWVEHGMIRKPGVFDDYRIHLAINCASVGCPALRPEAFTAERLGPQLEDNLVRFLSDRSRNRYNAEKKKLEVSKIFAWYGDDFISREGSLADFFARYAEYLSEDPEHQAAIKLKTADIDYLDYDWALNDIR